MPKKSSSDLRGNRKQGDVLATLLGEILGIILVALLTLVVTGRPPDPLIYVGIVLAFIGLPVLAALVALYYQSRLMTPHSPEHWR